MKQIVVKALLCIMLAFGTTASASANYDVAVIALETGDYDAATKVFRALTGQGDALAEYLLGSMYDNGEVRSRGRCRGSPVVLPGRRAG